MNYKEKLLEYIHEDESYQLYSSGLMKNVNDFDQFCINHCQNIKQALDEIDRLEKIADELLQIINECKMLIPHDFDWKEQVENIKKRLESGVNDEK